MPMRPGSHTICRIEGEADRAKFRRAQRRFQRARIAHARTRLACASRSISSAALRAAGPTLAPASMRASSPSRSLPATRATRVVASPASLALLDHEMRVGERRDRREVRDAQHLPVTRDVGDRAADPLRDRAADAGVDLVEDVETGGTAVGEHALQREQRARELAARGDPPERARVDARVRRDQELDAIDAVATETRAVDVELGSAALRTRRRRRPARAPCRARRAPCRSRRRAASRPSCAPRRARAPSRRPSRASRAPRRARSARRSSRPRASDSISAIMRSRGCEHGVTSPPCWRMSLLELKEPLVDLGSRSGSASIPSA